jgi:hypothetical protein
MTPIAVAICKREEDGWCVRLGDVDDEEPKSKFPLCSAHEFLVNYKEIITDWGSLSEDQTVALPAE